MKDNSAKHVHRFDKDTKVVGMTLMRCLPQSISKSLYWIEFLQFLVANKYICDCALAHRGNNLDLHNWSLVLESLSQLTSLTCLNECNRCKDLMATDQSFLNFSDEKLDTRELEPVLACYLSRNRHTLTALNLRYCLFMNLKNIMWVYVYHLNSPGQVDWGNSLVQCSMILFKTWSS